MNDVRSEVVRATHIPGLIRIIYYLFLQEGRKESVKAGRQHI